jgi:Ras GTPase-activating-like protein IQGAP2/3
MIHQSLIPGSNVTEDQALDNPEVRKTLEKRIQDLERVCQQFFDAVFSTMDKLPYGLRWICKMMRALCEKQLPDASKDDLLRLTGYFVYYRFINVALVSPEAFKIVTRELGTKERKNLIVVGKVLQKAFNLKSFGKAEKSLMPLVHTPCFSVVLMLFAHLPCRTASLRRSIPTSSSTSTLWCKSPIPRTTSRSIVSLCSFSSLSLYLLIFVFCRPCPSAHSAVPEYNEITQKEKPVIVINLSEMISIHRLVYEKLDSLASADDQLRSIMKDLGAPPAEFSESDNREIQLTLQSRFKKELKEDEQNLVTYAETKELCIPILRATPLGSSFAQVTLPDVLEAGAEFAKQTNNAVLAEQVATVAKNLKVKKSSFLLLVTFTYTIIRFSRLPVSSTPRTTTPSWCTTLPLRSPTAPASASARRRKLPV